MSVGRSESDERLPTHGHVLVLEAPCECRKDSIFMLLLDNPRGSSKYSVSILSLSSFFRVAKGEKYAKQFRPLLVYSH